MLEQDGIRGEYSKNTNLFSADFLINLINTKQSQISV